MIVPEDAAKKLSLITLGKFKKGKWGKKVEL